MMLDKLKELYNLRDAKLLIFKKAELSKYL